MAENALLDRWAGWTTEDEGVGGCADQGAFKKQFDTSFFCSAA